MEIARALSSDDDHVARGENARALGLTRTRNSSFFRGARAAERAFFSPPAFARPTMGAVKDFIVHHYRHFNAASLIDAAKGWATHLQKGGKMLLTMAGAMST